MGIKIVNLNNGNVLRVRKKTDLIKHLDNLFKDEDNNDYNKDDDDVYSGKQVDNTDTSSRKNTDTYNLKKFYPEYKNVNGLNAEDEEKYISRFELPMDDELESDYDAPESVSTDDLNDYLRNKKDDYDFDGEDSEDDSTLGDQEDAQDGMQDDGVENGEEEQEGQNDFQGLIRTVRGACLVYKRKNESGTFDELWIYNVGNNLKDETNIRRGILSGTDINPDTQMSDDGTQRAKTFSVGNVQYLNLLNIPQ